MLNEWVCLQIGIEYVNVEGGVHSTAVKIHKIITGKETPFLAATQQIQPETRTATIDVHGALGSFRANKQTRPRMLKTLKRSSLKIISSKILWHCEVPVWRRSKGLVAISWYAHIVQVEFPACLIELECTDKLTHVHPFGFLQMAP